MARPLKEGLDYFPLDVHADTDDKFQLIEALHGATGFAVVIKLFMKIYSQNFYYKWTETEELLFSKRVNVDINTVRKIVNDCINYDLFDNNKFNEHKILTSYGIQERYFAAIGRRKKQEVVQEYLLLNKQEVLDLCPKIVFVNINKVNDDINATAEEFLSTLSTQSKVKESKGKESKASSDDEGENPIRLFEENIGNLSPIQIQDLLQWQDELGKELTMFAVSHAAMKSAKYYGFVQNLFKDWSSHNIDTVEKAKNYENQKQPSYKQKEERSSEYEYIRENNDPGW